MKSLGKANSGVEAYRAGFFSISGPWAVDCLPESDERGRLAGAINASSKSKACLQLILGKIALKRAWRL